jgi:hypothetical protein
VLRITLNGYDPSVLDLGQQAAGVGTVLSANSAFPQSRSSLPSNDWFEKKGLISSVLTANKA